MASKLPEKSPCYVFYSFPTPPAPKPARAAPAAASPAAARDVFQASAGGARNVAASTAPRWDAEEGKGEGKEEEETKEETKETDEDAKETNGEETKAVDAAAAAADDDSASTPAPDVSALNVSDPDTDADKGRVVFIYWCPSGSPVRFRMVYSTTVRGIQQDAIDKVQMPIAGKLETSDKTDLNEGALREALGSSSSSPSAFSSFPRAPKHSNSLPTPGAGAFGQPRPAGRFGSATSASGSPTTPTSPPVFGAPAGPGFGRPMPGRTTSTVSADAVSQSTPADDEDSKDRIANAFNAFGPRVGGSSGGFARPKPAGRR